MLLPVTSAETPVTAGNAQVRIVHAASAAPTVGIYVSAPDAMLADEQPLATAEFTDATDLVQVPAMCILLLRLTVQWKVHCHSWYY